MLIVLFSSCSLPQTLMSKIRFAFKSFIAKLRHCHDFFSDDFVYFSHVWLSYQPSHKANASTHIDYLLIWKTLFHQTCDCVRVHEISSLSKWRHEAFFLWISNNFSPLPRLNVFSWKVALENPALFKAQNTHRAPAQRWRYVEDVNI